MSPSLYKSNVYNISQQIINKYASVSGGEAKIHTDPEYANQTIFKGTLVHGFYLIALIENELANIFNDWKGTLDVKFLKPIKVNKDFWIELRKNNDREIEVNLITDNNQTAVYGKAEIR